MTPGNAGAEVGTSVIKVANAPCSWGVRELGSKMVGYAQVLDEIRDTGYAGTELGDWGFMPPEPMALRHELARRDLALVGAFVPVAFADESRHSVGEAAALQTARLLAAVNDGAFVILADENGTDPARTQHAGRITERDRLSPHEWRRFINGVHRIARTVQRDTGLRCVFHHHCAGFIETPRELERLMRDTDPALLGLCFDTGHYRFGGGDPLAAIAQFGDRIRHVHFKDCSPTIRHQSREREWDYFASLEHGLFCELGRGDIDFGAIVTQLRSAGYQGWVVVEQDVLPGMGTPKECARRNREFFRTLDV